MQAYKQAKEVLSQARQFIEQYCKERSLSREQREIRLHEIEQEIFDTGTYRHTLQELTYGIQVSTLGMLAFSTYKI